MASIGSRFIAGVLWLLVSITNGCRDEGRIGIYEEFFRLSISEQQQLIGTYPQDKQVDIYLASRHYVHPHVYHLAHAIARNGESIVPHLIYRLEHTDSDIEKADLFWVFPLLQSEGNYAVEDDKSLVALLAGKLLSIESEAARESAVKSFERIRGQEGRSP